MSERESSFDFLKGMEGLNFGEQTPSRETSDTFECTDNGKKSHSESPFLDTGQSDDPSICPYCSKKFRKPRVLDCLHSMCEDCVIANLDHDGRSQHNLGRIASYMELEQDASTRPTPPGVIRCPICSQETHIGNDVMFVQAMLLDFVRIRESGSNDKNADSGERICRSCKGEEAAVANCLHCLSDLCAKCVQAHRDMRMFDGHKVVMFSEINKDSSEATKNSLGNEEEPIILAICNKHKADYEGICCSCDELLCKQCMAEHMSMSHSCNPLNDSYRAFVYQHINELALKAKEKGQITLDARSSIPERKELLKQSYLKCREKIEQSFQYYVQVLNGLKLDLLADLDRNKEEKEEYLEGLYQKIDMQTTKLEDALEYTRRLLEKGTTIDLCISKKKVWQQLRTLIHSMPDASAEVDLDFDTLPKQEFPKRLEAIVGSIKCRIAGISKEKGFSALVGAGPIKIEGIGSSGQAGIANQIHLPAYPAATVWDLGNKMAQQFQPQQQSNAQQHPGAIGMERRQNRNSNGNSYLSGDSGNISLASELAHSSPVGNIGTPTLENYGLGRLGMSDNYAGFRTPTNFLNNPLDANQGLFENSIFPDNYLGNQQSAKLWGSASNFNSQSIFSSFDGISNQQQRPRELMDSRYPASEFEMPGMRSRSSLCATPSIDAFMPPVSQPDFTITAGRNQYGGQATATDMTLCIMFGGDMNNMGDTFNTPQGVCLGMGDEIAVADTNNHRCIVVNKRGSFVRNIGSSGTEEGSVYYPKKIVSFIRGDTCHFVVLDRGNNQLFNRLQLFKNSGEYICKLIPPCTIDQVTVMSVNKENEQLIIIDNKNLVHAFEFETFNQLRLVRQFSISGFVHEASDIGVYKGQYFITDYKTHCVVIYTLEGKHHSKFGGLNITPYPVGIDFSKTGDILVGDSHGNHYHIVVFNSQGQPQHQFRCHMQKVSRCTGLKLSENGDIVTLSRQNSSVLVFNMLTLPPN